MNSLPSPETLELRLIEGKRDPDSMCQAARPGYLGNTRVWELFCTNEASEAWRYGCLHEHVKVRSTCRDHRPEPGSVGCRQCLEQGHECPMIAERVHQ